MYIFSLVVFFWKVYTKIKNRFSENNEKKILYSFITSRLNVAPEGDMIKK